MNKNSTCERNLGHEKKCWGCIVSAFGVFLGIVVLSFFLFLYAYFNFPTNYLFEFYNWNKIAALVNLGISDANDVLQPINSIWAKQSLSSINKSLLH